MITWHSTRAELETTLRGLATARERIESYLASLRKFRGYCACCDEITALRVGEPKHDGWCNLRESFVCRQCGLNGRMRMTLIALREALAAAPEQRALMFERLTPLFTRVAAEFPFVQGSEYLGADLASGEIREVGSVPVCHQDMLDLSFPDASLDVLFHGDVLEHVPDYLAGLRECCRVLAPGGVLLFTCPFFDREEHTRRARLVNGEVVHDLEPAFHGNPISAKGSLVFTEHGWPLLRDLRDGGFQTVEIGLLYDPFQGIVSNNNPYPIGHMWPVLFRATR